ncbi:MAG: hypothetical protein PHG63_00855 [Candidatus Dojkabacteria bacterium]|nr:hypothetical protein [Candidatus Dojkabacteria bacterium]
MSDFSKDPSIGNERNEFTEDERLGRAALVGWKLLTRMYPGTFAIGSPMEAVAGEGVMCIGRAVDPRDQGTNTETIEGSIDLSMWTTTVSRIDGGISIIAEKPEKVMVGSMEVELVHSVRIVELPNKSVAFETTAHVSTERGTVEEVCARVAFGPFPTNRDELSGEAVEFEDVHLQILRREIPVQPPLF